MAKHEDTGSRETATFAIIESPLLLQHSVPFRGGLHAVSNGSETGRGIASWRVARWGEEGGGLSSSLRPPFTLCCSSPSQLLCPGTPYPSGRRREDPARSGRASHNPTRAGASEDSRVTREEA